MPALEATHDEMPAGERLEMVGEGGVDRRPAERAQDRRGLRRQLLAHRDAEARGDQRHQPGDRRRGLGGDPLGGDEARAVGDRLGERGPDGEIAALERRLPRLAAEREHFDAGESGARRAQVLSFLARDLGDRAQKDGGRDRQFDRQRGEAQRASDRARGGGGELVRAVGGPGRRVEIERAEREPERASQGGLARLRDHAARERRHGATQHSGRAPIASVRRWAKLVPSRQSTARLKSAVSPAVSRGGMNSMVAMGSASWKARPIPRPQPRRYGASKPAAKTPLFRRRR